MWSFVVLTRTAAFAGASIACVFFASCAKSPTSDDASASAPTTWPLRGEIIAVNKERSSLTVAHEEIKGYMPAMTMELRVSAGDLANALPGQRIRGKLRQSDEGFFLDDIWPADEATDRTLAAAEKILRQDTMIRGKNPYREVGEMAPEFALLDQDGRVVSANRFRGRSIVMNFIFTRCPVPEMCPAATLRMHGLQKALRDEGLSNVELLSVSLDPAYDTPGTLKEYAASRGIETTNFTFLTGPEVAVKDLMAQVGVQAFPSDGLIKHSMATLLIDPTGRIVHREDGTQWDIEQFLSRLRRNK